MKATFFITYIMVIGGLELLIVVLLRFTIMFLITRLQQRMQWLLR
ncbi:unnamed protein product [Linum tenue]|uniref:Uncharacterized protein n=1 Tax=Linum tenue TaxID=586396 RepID=A0AAV0RZD6_9ROSI|nr:unnamed protein product [Linum tenue]